MRRLLPLFALCFINTLSASPSPEEQVFQNDRAALMRADTINRSSNLNLQTCEMVKLHGGISGARIYSLEKPNGEKFVARFVPRTNSRFPDELQNEVIASASQTTPLVHFTYLTSSAAIVVRNFVADDRTVSRESENFYKKLARSIHTLHASQPFERELHFPEFLKKFGERLQNEKFDIPASDDLKHTVQAGYVTLSSLWPKFAGDIRGVHHDLSPLNICYDGRNVCLIDWEMASRDAFWVDLAVAANFHCWTNESTNLFLKSYFEREPTPLESAKFTFFRPFAHMFHALNLAYISKYKEPIPEDVLNAIPWHPDFQSLIRSGQVDLSQSINQMRLAISTMKRAAELLGTDDFKDAVNLISNS